MEKVEQGLKKRIDDKQIVKLDKGSDEHSISPVLITAKNDKSIKVALDLKKLNDAKQKNKYYMKSIDNINDSVAIYISEGKKSSGNFFLKRDL